MADTRLAEIAARADAVCRQAWTDEQRAIAYLLRVLRERDAEITELRLKLAAAEAHARLLDADNAWLRDANDAIETGLGIPAEPKAVAA